MQNLKTIVLVLAFISPIYLQACSCAGGGVDIMHILQHDLVFKGTVVQKEILKEGAIDASFEYTFDVEEWVKGDKKKKQVKVLSPTSGSMCGVNYDVGASLYIFSHKYKDTNQTGLCNMNTSTNYADAYFLKLMEQYKKGQSTTWFNRADIKIAEGKIAKGKQKYYWKINDRRGFLESEGKYKKGKKHGVWKYYKEKTAAKEEDVLASTVTYKRGKEISKTIN